MRTKIFGGAVLGLLCLVATSFAGWDATDKALGHEGKTMRMNYSYRSAPATVVVTPATVPQVAQSNSNTARRSFSVEPNASTANSSNTGNVAPRYYSNNARSQHQPNYMSADTKILGHEGR